MRTESGIDFNNGQVVLGAAAMPGVLTDGITFSNPDDFRPGVETISRGAATVSLTTVSNTMRLTYFRSRSTILVKNISVGTAATAAATVTTIRMGIYTVAANGDITLAASTTNDTSGNPTVQIEYVQAITTPSTGYQLTAGTRYAVGFLFSGTTAPALAGSGTAICTGLATTTTPILAGTAAAVANDLPTTVVNASITGATARLYHNLV